MFEALLIDDDLRDAIASGAASTTLAKLAAQHAHQSLFDDAAGKLLSGVTTFEEIERVLGWWLR